MLIIACVFVFKSLLLGQNLIQNSSFENYSNINCGGGGFDNYSMIGTPHVVDNWYSLNSADYFNSICPNGGWYSIPNTYFGSVYPKQGNAVAAIGVYDIRNDYNEYIYQYLPTPLQSGKLYCLSLFVSRAERFPFAIHSIGAYFSSSIPSLISNYYVNSAPQVLNQSGFIIDTIGWSEIQGCFTASGGEQYITIGNFNSNANTDTVRIQSSNLLTGTGTDVSYYYIDDVTLIDQAAVGLNELGTTNSIEIYPNPVNDILNITSEKIIENLYLKIFNLLGELIYTERLNSYHSSLNTENLKNGIYFYNIVMGDKIIKSNKIVIVK